MNEQIIAEMKELAKKQSIEINFDSPKFRDQFIKRIYFGDVNGNNSTEFIEEFYEFIDWNKVAIDKIHSIENYETQLEALRKMFLENPKRFNAKYIMNAFNYDNNHDYEIDIIEIFNEYIDFNILSTYNLKEKTIIKYKDKLNWKYLSRGAVLTNKIVNDYYYLIDWDEVINNRNTTTRIEIIKILKDWCAQH